MKGIAIALLVACPLAAQQVVPESVKVVRPNPMAALGGRAVVIKHLTPYRADSGASYAIRPGDSIGVIQAFPTPLSQRHNATLARADSLYNERRYEDAASELEGPYRAEPKNPFVLNAYARTLFWIDRRRSESFEVYRRLIALLDEQGGTRDSAISVDMWFQEAYWKIASLYLDREEYDKAAFEITRYLAAGTPRDARIRGQAFDYLTEAYYHLQNEDLTRWYAAAALRLNPADRYALDFLYRMGPRATARAATDALACRRPADTAPAIGAYSFYRDHSGFHCVTDTRDNDGTIAPCLRIGWIYVGLPRDEIERLLGTPWKSLRHEADGHDIAVYLVFRDTEHDRGAYYAVEYEPAGDHQVAESVQLTADPPPLPMDFSCLQLGDPTERVTGQLGAPDKSETFDDESMHLRGIRWEYRDVPISIEIVNGKVYSLKVWRPDALAASERRLKFSALR